MDTQDSSLLDAPHMKLAKVGKDRDRKRGGAGWLSGARAGSGFSGAVGGAGAGMGGFMGTGMSLAKILMVLLVTAGVSAGAWKMGGMLANNSAADANTAPPKVFADKDSGKYADTSGVIKAENSIPNSLGYINNDGLTAEQRAKKAADDAAAAAAAAKAEADAKAKADAEAKAKADADAKAAATADASAPAAGVPKIGLGSGKFGSFSSAFGGSGGLSGGSGMSGGIARNFAGMDGIGSKGQKGDLSAFRNASKVATTKTATPTPGKSNAKGFAGRQLTDAYTGSRQALAAGTNESAAAGAGAPFDNNAGKGTTIAGPGVGNGTQTGPADGGGGLNPGSGVGGGPISNPTSCGNGQQVDGNGNCQNVSTPGGMNGAPYQSLVNAVLLLLGVVTILTFMAKFMSKTEFMKTYALQVCLLIAALGAIIAMMGIMIMAMPHGDFVIGGIIAAVGAYVSVTAFKALSDAGGISAGMNATEIAKMGAGPLIASAVGMLAAASKAGPAMMH